ncbi:MAG: signal transduction protein [Pseudomonadota bacterium]
MTTTRTYVAASLAVCAVLVGASALAQPAAVFARADANNDGAVSRAEATDARRAMFARLDRNADNMISDEELRSARNRIAAMARMADSIMLLRSQRLDVDGDGSLTEAEFMASNPMFDRIDRDGDGVATAEEISVIRDQFTQQTR